MKGFLAHTFVRDFFMKMIDLLVELFWGSENYLLQKSIQYNKYIMSGEYVFDQKH